MKRWVKRALLHLVIKKIWQGVQTCDILLTEEEKKKVRSDALLLKNSLLFEILEEKVVNDGFLKLYQAKDDYDLIFPQAQIYTIRMVRGVLQEIINDAQGNRKIRKELISRTKKRSDETV